MGIFVLLMMFALVLLNMPIAFTLVVASIIGLVVANGGNVVSLNMVPSMIFDGVCSFPLLAVPLFTLMGEVMNSTGLSKKIINLASTMIGFVRGGLAMVTVLAAMFFAELSGSAVAGAAALGGVLIPQMTDRGYPKNYSTAVLSSAATIAILIPPSGPLVLYGVIANLSIAKLFIAGIIPGVLCGAGLMVVAYILARRYNLPTEAAFSLPRFWQAFKEGFLALLIPIVVLGGIFGGIFTPTEAAGVAVMVACIAGFREFKVKDLPEILSRTGKQTAVVTLIVGASYLLSWFLTAEMIPQSIAAWVVSTTNNRYVVLVILNVFLLFLGTILHSSAAIVMTTPLVLPLIRQVGIDPIHWGLIMTLNLGIGQQTPPVASVLMTSCSIAGISIMDCWKFLKYFLIAMLVVLLLVTYIPQISLFLPGLLTK